MADDGGCHDCICIQLDCCVNEFFGRAGCAEVMHFDAVFFNAAVLNVDDLTKTDRVLVFTDGCGNDLHRTTFDIGTDNVIAQNIGFLGNDKGINIDCERNFALDFDAGAFLRMHDFTADNFAFDKIHALCTFKCSRFRNGLGCGEEHGEHDSTVCKPFHFRTNLLAACNEIFDFFHTDMAVVGFVQFINIDDLFGAFKRAAADECGGIVDKIGIVLLNVVVAVVCGDGSHVVSFALENCSGTDAAVDFSCNAVAVALGVNAAVNEEAFFNGVEIAAEFKHFFHEEDRSFL